MRPLRLHLENFVSFREATTIDFSDVDYFVLLGPTGAGKSTVIDGICFALYGTVPRWGRENVIAYALAPSAIAGKTALVFETGGRRHAVIRVLQRNPRGVVQTKEAILYELDPTVPADAPLEDLLAASIGAVADGERVTAAIQQITGLDYKFFTQCVVLPQGRFAEFLHAPQRQRQDLLVQLLDAEVYEEVRKEAVVTERTATEAAELAEGQLSGLADANEVAEDTAVRRISAMRTLTNAVCVELDALRVRESDLAARQEEVSVVQRNLTALAALATPPGVDELGADLRTASSEVETCERESAAAEAAEHAADDALSRLGDEAALNRELNDHDARDRLMARISAAEHEVSAVTESLGQLAEQRTATQKALDNAENDLERFRTAHAGAALARHLAIGEPCPTCRQLVHELPVHKLPNDLAAAEALVDECREEARQATRRHEAADYTVELRTDDLGRFHEELKHLPPTTTERAEVEQCLAAMTHAKDSARDARREARAARGRLDAARKRLETLYRSADRRWQEISKSRDGVVSLGAPLLRQDDLLQAWTSLLAWRDEAAESQRSDLERKAAGVSEVEAQCESDLARIHARLPAEGLEVTPNAGPEAIRITLATETASAERRLERIRENRSRAAELTAMAQAQRHEAQVAHELTNVLRANAFERWLCHEALDLLVTAGSVTLRELSDGQYELALGTSGEIEVIDHAEAGMRRNVRTLSGGETFQAALALALALSGQLSGLATAAAHSLESIFLDEGFGTLDPVTLDTVAITLERLTIGTERMVGIVTHVPSLAERVPVRFEVTRDVKGSHLRKVGP